MGVLYFFQMVWQTIGGYSHTHTLGTNEVNALQNDGRLVYFEDPSGHFLEIRTRPSRA